MGGRPARTWVRVWPMGQETSWGPQRRVVLQADKMQAGKTIPSIGNSLCRRNKEEYGVLRIVRQVMWLE